MTKKTRRKIELGAKKKAEIAKTFGVSIQNVSQALLYKRNSLKAEKIREAHSLTVEHWYRSSM